jgi:succinyl-diaminopimelate desuccinylase
MDLLKLAKEHQEDFLNDLNTLVSIESTRDKEHAYENAPFGPNPRKALDAMLEMGKRDGFDTQDVDGYAGVISYGDQSETLGILGHLDIVPLGEGWTKDPLKVTLNDGYIFGRGVMDDKGPALAAYYAMKILKEQGVKLNKKIMVICGCDEESGMECMNYYKDHGQIPDMGFVPDANFPVIYGEKGGAHIVLKSDEPTVIESLHAGSRPNIVIGKADVKLPSMSEEQEKEFAFYLKSNQLEGSVAREDDGVILHIEGVPAHAAMPYLGVNAALHLLNFVGAAYDDKLARDLYGLLKDWQGQPAGIFKEGLYMGFLTMNTGIVDIENNHTEVMVDIRYPNEMSGADVHAGFAKAAAEKESKIEVILDSDSKPLFVDPNSKLVKDLMSSYAKFTGDTTSPAITIGGGTYARKFDNFVSFGPELPNEVIETEQFVGGCHQRDEGIKLDNLIQAIAIYADAILNLAV